VPRHVVRLVPQLVAARHAARRRLLCLAQACRRLLRLRRASGCLDTSCGSSRGSSRRSSSTTLPRAGSSSTTSPTPRVRMPRHVARLVMRLIAPLVVDYSASRRLVVDYFASVTRLGVSARRAARHVATPCAATSSCGHAGSTSATPCVMTTCLAATLTLLRVRSAPPRRHLPVASRRPLISTSFPN
jgi:hypothetical protein